MDTSWKRRVILLKYNSYNSSYPKGVKMRGDGYYIRNSVIYVDGELEGKRYRKSTGLPVTKKNISYVQKNHHVILQNIVEESQKTTFTEFALQVIENGSYNRTIAYQKEVVSKFERYINPYFKHREFSEIKPMIIENWQNMLLKKYSAATVKKYTNILKQIMRKALANDLCMKDPFIGVDIVKKAPPKKRAIYTEDEMFNIISNASGWFKTFIVTAFATGMRTGELLALKWSDIDFEKRVITVQRNINHAVIKESTKTNKSRTIDMLDLVYDALSNEFSHKKNDEWIFTNKYDEPFSESKNILKYYFKPLLEKIGVEYKSLYSSRHSFISLMLNRGMDLMWVQNIAGHASSTTTLKYYAMYMKSDAKRLQKANNIMQNNGTHQTQMVIS